MVMTLNIPVVTLVDTEREAALLANLAQAPSET